MKNLLRNKEFQKLIAFFGGAGILFLLAVTLTPGGWGSLFTDMHAFLAFAAALAGMIIGSKWVFPRLAAKLSAILAWLIVFVVFMIAPFLAVLAIAGAL